MQLGNLGYSSQSIKFKAFGVRIVIDSNNPQILEDIEHRIPKIVPCGFEKFDGEEFDHLFSIIEKPNDKLFEIYKNFKKLEWWINKNALLEYLDSQLRITIAEYAVSRVFIHAGVVAWKGSAIIIPGKSYSGKTTLVAEFIKRGAVYYSDEYAVIDERGNVHPFPKMLSMRGIIDNFTQVDFAPEDLGGKIGFNPLPVKFVLITRFAENAVWTPSKLTTGEGMMEILPHTIPIRFNPAFTLKVLNTMASHALIIKGKRGEAKNFVPLFLNHLETKTAFT